MARAGSFELTPPQVIFAPPGQSPPAPEAAGRRPRLPNPSLLEVALLVAGVILIGGAGYLLNAAVDALDKLQPEKSAAQGWAFGATTAAATAVAASAALTFLAKNPRHWIPVGSAAVLGIATGQFFAGTIEPSFGPAEDGGGGGWGGEFGASLFVPLAVIVVGINARFAANRAWGHPVLLAGIALGGTQYVYVGSMILANLDHLAAAATEAWTPDPVYVPGLGFLLAALATIGVVALRRRRVDLKPPPGPL